eukprot:TRINITY_DN4740_c0_g1_i1.p1 TRINITY_DN4740_c0_g1~~TRINITY_DN4740_c0_g1_i1.p1  ORF type:complete len:263 (-),score=57.16 TRINITY_DN4740_c0_g1_i1:1028-1816(-)
MYNRKSLVSPVDAKIFVFLCVGFVVGLSIGRYSMQAAISGARIASRPKLWAYFTQERSEIIRLILEESGLDYEFITVTDVLAATTEKGGSIPEYMPFGQVPYYQDEHVRIGQYMAIARYLARKTGLHGSTPEEGARVDMVADSVTDFLDRLSAVFKAPPSQARAARKRFMEEDGPKSLAYFEAILNKAPDGVDSEFHVGRRLTYADLYVFHALEWVQAVDAQLLNRFPHLLRFYEGVRDRPRIQSYAHSSRRPAVPQLPSEE